MTVDEIIQKTIKKEGWYVNDPLDRGGETKFGITVKTARRHGYEGPMLDLPVEKAIEIYKSEYWKFDDVLPLSGDLAFILFDFGVTAGPNTAIEVLQTALSALSGQLVIADGVLGPKSVQALKTVFKRREAPVVLAGLVRAMILLHYVGIVEKNESQQRFIWGWLNRALT